MSGIPDPTIAFDSTATFSPSTSPSTVVLTGSATNIPNIASIVIYDGTNEIGEGTFSPGETNWSATVNLSPGSHDLTAVMTNLTGATTTVAAPYELVLGINNQACTFQERDRNAFGTVVRVSSYDASGAIVSQTSIAGSGGASAPLSVAFDPTATYLNSTAATLTGTTTGYGSASTIEIFDGAASSVVNPTTGGIIQSAKALGYATVNSDGTWTFDAHVSPGQHEFTAVAVGLNGVAAAAQSPFDLMTGIVGSPYVYQEIDHAANGSVAAITSYGTDGSIVGRSDGGGLTINGGTSTGEVRRSSHNDVFSGDETGGTTFVFTRGFGQDEITDFNYLNATQSPSGIEHDVVSLPQSVFQTMAQVMRHTTSALDGDAVIHLSRTDTIKLDGVTKAELITHPDVFRFHS